LTTKREEVKVCKALNFFDQKPFLSSSITVSFLLCTAGAGDFDSIDASFLKTYIASSFFCRFGILYIYAHVIALDSCS
jgi:hypothetical protein